MKFKSPVPFLFVASLFALAACGGGSGSSSSSKQNENAELQEDNDQGIYRAVLSPVNKKLVANTTGTIEVRIDGDEVVIESTVAGAPSGVKHFQNIMTSSECPTEASDANGDGVVDIMEGSASFGKILVPLDSNISDQLLGNDFGPIANGAGAYVYRKSTSFAQMMADLNAEDPDKEDFFAKLSPTETLRLSKRVVVVHGVSRNSDLPATVATLGDAAADQLIPIACGKLVKVHSEDTTTADAARRETSSETTTGARFL